MQITEFLFSCPSRNAANNFVKYSSSPAYTYRFSHAPDFLPRVGNYMQCFDDKVCHALELPFTWHGITSRFFSPEEEALSQEMISYAVFMPQSYFEIKIKINIQVLDIVRSGQR